MEPPPVEFSSLSKFRAARADAFDKGPAAMVVVEDRVEIASTLAHLHGLGFAHVFVFAPDDITIPDAPPDARGAQHVIRGRSRMPGTAQLAVNTLIEKRPGEWVHYCYNGEYLFFPFCEDRSIGEVTTWVMEERRASVLTYVIDLYATDLTTHPNAVSRDTAMLDASGYYAEGRPDPDNHNYPRERQLNFYGGLRWRFEEHVPRAKRRIDRVGLFRAQPGLTLRDDHTLSDEEMNTYACPWHHSLTAAICSFRVAKALRTNPGSRDEIADFRWHKSTPFQWSSLQLMELGLMEPGQWF